MEGRHEVGAHLTSTTLGGRISDTELGKRIRTARERVRLSQLEAAELIGAARTTIVAIEQGQRRIRIDELQKLANRYGTSVNALLRREAQSLDLAHQFRKLHGAEDCDVEAASVLLNDLVNAEVELENVLGIQRARKYPPERPILPGDVRAQAEQDAQELRDWLGLGPGPITNVVDLLELHLGVKVYLRPLNSKIAGLFAFDESVGACILLNANHRNERLSHTAWHEIGHLVSSRRSPEVLFTNERLKSREETYADTFSRCFLTPARAVRQRFADVTAGSSHFTRRHVILMASSFGVSREALGRRLEELALVGKGTWDWFVANGGITDEQARQVLGEQPDRIGMGVLGRALVPPRVALLAREAWKRGIYSEGQLAQLLHLDLLGVRELLEGAEFEESEADDLVKLVQ